MSSPDERQRDMVQAMATIFGTTGMLPGTLWLGPEPAKHFGLPEVWSIATRQPVGWMIHGGKASPIYDEEDLPR